MIAGADQAQLAADAIEVGIVVDAFGVKGWVKIRPHSSDPQALFSSKRWYLVDRQGSSPADAQATPSSYALRVREAKTHSGAVVALIEGVEDRDAALQLRGGRILVPRSSFPTPQTGEFYWVDLIGLAVVNRQGQELGRVGALHPTGPHAVLVLEGPDSAADAKKSSCMIPFVSAYVDSVDLHGRRIVVDWHADY